MADPVEPLNPDPGATTTAGLDSAAAGAPPPSPAVVAAEPSPAPVAEPHPSEVPTLLEGIAAPGKEVQAEPAPDAPKAEPAKDAAPAPDAPKPDAAKDQPKADEPAKDAPKPEPVAPADYSTLKMPDGFTANDERMGQFTGLVSATDKSPAERAQGLLDLAGQVMNEWAENFQKDALNGQIRAFNETRQGWRNKIMADPVLGGAGHDTAMGVVARMRDLFVSSSENGSPQYDKDMGEFVDMLRMTGAGDHPAFHRFLHNVGRLFDEPAPPPPNFKPPPDLGKKPKGGLRDLYKS